MSNGTPDSSDPGRTPSVRIALTCIALGLICLAFPFIAQKVDHTLFGRNIYLFSASMAFGLFLAAVGGYATGRWGSWTFGGAAATVVALFLLIVSTGDDDTAAGTAVIARLHGKDLYKDFQIVEVEDFDGKRLFTAPNRTLNYANILIEKDNLNTECLTFLFLPSPGAAGGADIELVDMRVPSRVFADELAEGERKGELRPSLTLSFNKDTHTIYRHPEGDADGDGTADAPLPLTGPGLCGGALFNIAAHTPQRDRVRGGFFTAHAAEAVPPELMERLVADDPLLRRDARSQLAALGPNILYSLFEAIPDPGEPTHYRIALGAAVALASMLAYADDETRQFAADALTDEALADLAALVAHEDETMRKWATAALVRLATPRSIDPLIAVLGDDSASLNGRYNAAFALAEIGPRVAEPDRMAIASAVAPILPALGPRTRSLLEGFEAPEMAADAAVASEDVGWVFLGFKSKGDWAETNFDLDDDEIPAAGTEIVARDRTSLRVAANTFDPATGWTEGAVAGVVEPGERLMVREVQEVAPGFYWAETQKSTE